MCTVRVLAQSKSGFISQCSECGNIQFAFGTSFLKLNEDEYDEIVSQINYDVQHVSDRVNPNSKSVQITHPQCAEFSLVLSTNKLIQLHQLVQEASILLTAYSILNDGLQ